MTDFPVSIKGITEYDLKEFPEKQLSNYSILTDVNESTKMWMCAYGVEQELSHV